MDDFDSAEVPTNISQDNIYQNVEAQFLFPTYDRDYTENKDQYPGKGTLYITTDLLVWIKEDKTDGFQLQISDMGDVSSDKEVISIMEIKDSDYEIMFLPENAEICDSICKKIENARTNVDREPKENKKEPDLSIENDRSTDEDEDYEGEGESSDEDDELREKEDDLEDDLEDEELSREYEEEDE